MNEIEREKERKKRQTRSSLLDVLHKINPSFHYSRRFVTRDHYSPFNETRAHSTRFTVIHPFFHDSILYRALFRVYFPPNHLPPVGIHFRTKVITSISNIRTNSKSWKIFDGRDLRYVYIEKLFKANLKFHTFHFGRGWFVTKDVKFSSEVNKLGFAFDEWVIVTEWQWQV